MRAIIRELKNRMGVRGAMIMTRDGVVVSEDLGDALDANSVAALASASVQKALRAGTALGLGRVTRVTFTATFGRLVFVPFDEMVLVVVTVPHLDLDLTLLEIAGPARRMLEMSRLGNPV